MTELDVILRNAFDIANELIDSEEPALTALDELSGDGDFGANLRGGFSLAAERASDRGGLDTWRALSTVFLDDVGGTSGPLLGLLFQQFCVAAESAASTEDVLRAGSRSGLDAIQRVGEAQPGDRTLVDALSPAADAFERGTLSEGVAAAVDGAIATKDIVARRGRASYVGQRALGTPDPGAVGIALIFIAFAQAAGTDTDDDVRRLRDASHPEISAKATPSAEPNPPQDAELDVLLTRAERAKTPLAKLSLTERAALLDALADALEGHSDELVAIADEETQLGRARLSGEVIRTSFQLRLFADLVRAGDFLGARIDRADSEWPPAPRPDLRRSQRPIGPVLVFAASNFPFAFSVLGGDTASALAAGNPVIVKAHPGHPRLSLRVAEIAHEALAAQDAPEGTFALIEGREASVTVLKDPRLKAASFTGSIPGGRALFDIAQSRPVPIPFFGELGSCNPVFVTPEADAASAREIAEGFVQSFTLGAGQFCTKPGVLLVPQSSAVTALLREQLLPDSAPMLNTQIRDGYHARLRELKETTGVELLNTAGDPFAADPAPALFLARGRDVLDRPHDYLDEVFGPASLVVEYASTDEMLQLAHACDGQLTATIYGTEEDVSQELIAALADRAGRLLWRQWPTGVAVTSAQQHGGPYPASTASQTTSVGTAAIERFLRPVAWQGFPDAMLPLELSDTAPGQ